MRGIYTVFGRIDRILEIRVRSESLGIDNLVRELAAYNERVLHVIRSADVTVAVYRVSYPDDVPLASVNRRRK